MVNKNSLTGRTMLAMERGVHRILVSLGLSPESVWRFSLLSEIYYWYGSLKAKRVAMSNTGSLSPALDPDLELQPHLIKILNQAGDEVKILDVGAGPLTVVGKKWNGHVIQLTAVDPLARVYGYLLDWHRLQPPVRTISGHAERLTELFPIDSFDLVHAQNSLDHAFDPVLGIGEMVAVAKPGGIVYMRHVPNEGQQQDYSGLHQWDFHVDDGKFLLSSVRETTNVTDALSKVADVECVLTHDQRWVEVKIRKHLVDVYRQVDG